MKSLMVLNVVAFSLLVLERLIGETILANLILIALAALVLVMTAVGGLIHMVERRTMQALVVLAVSATMGGYIAARLSSDSFPVGYGP